MYEKREKRERGPIGCGGTRGVHAGSQVPTLIRERRGGERACGQG